MSGCIKDDGCDLDCDGCKSVRPVSAREALERVYAKPEFSAWLDRVRRRAAAHRAELAASRVQPSPPAYHTTDYEPLTIRDVL